MNEITYEIEHSPSYASLRLDMQPQQTVIVEAGAMAAMDSCIQMKSKMRGGLGKGVGRMVSGESLFLSEFTAKNQAGQLFISPGVPGDIQHYFLNGNGLILQSSGFVASGKNVDLETQFQGFKGFFSGESLFFLKATGIGDVWFSSYGAIMEINVTGNYVVDTGYIVAFEDSLNYQVEVIGGLSFNTLRTGVFGGEGLVCRFRGEGRLWIQTRNLLSLLNFFYPFRPVETNNN
ncbi:MAG: TIGR00266 family protein [Microcoleaceae cyanobacterium]